MRIVRTLLFAACLVVLIQAITPTVSFAYLPGAVHTWGPATPNYNHGRLGDDDNPTFIPTMSERQTRDVNHHRSPPRPR